MNKPVVATIVAATVTTVSVLLNIKKNHDYNEYFAETFPQLDLKLLKKAHDALMRKAFLQKLDMTNWSQAAYEEALVAEYKLLNQ